MTPRQKHSILQLVQQLTEEAATMGALIAEDSKDTRPEKDRGSTHECRTRSAARVRAIRMQIEAELSQIVTDDAAFCGTS